jgi:hypothetical protein
MIKFILPCLLFSATFATAQPTIQWQKTYGGSFANNDIQAESLTADGGYILAGTLNFSDALLVKLDASGNTVWKKTYGGTNNDKFYSVQQTTDGGYIAAGSTSSNDGDVSGLHNDAGTITDIWVVKLDAAGNITWQKCLGGSLYDGYAGAFIKQAADGGFIIASSSNSNDGDITGNHGSDDCVVIKLNSTGGIVWQKSLGGTQVDNASSISQTNEGGYIVAVASASNDGDVSGHHGAISYSNNDYWIVKLNATGAVTWQKSLGGTNDDYPASIQQTADNGYIISGKSKSLDGDVTGNHGSYDYWVVKTDASGTIVWQKSLGGTAEDDGLAIQQTTDGGYIVCGQSVSNDGDVSGHNMPIFYPDAWVVKLTGTGAITWQKCLGGSTADYGSDIKEIAGSFALVGSYNSRGYYNAADYWLAKLDATGNTALQVTTGASGGDDYCYSSQQTADGGYIMVGDVASTNGDVTNAHGLYDWWVVKTSSTGAIQWKKSLGGSGNDYAQSIKQTSDGGYIVAGETSSNDGDVTGNHGLNDCWVVKLDPSGNITWQKTLGGTGSDFAEDIIQTTDGGYIMEGGTTSNDGDVSGNHGGLDYWVVKLTAAGNISWQKCLGGTGYDYAYSIKQTSDGGYIVAGDVNSNDGDVSGNHGSFDYWIVKLDAAGNITWKKIMGGTGEEDARDIQQTTDGGYIIAGFSNSIDGDVTGNHGDFDYWIVKINAAGNISWQKSLGGSQSDAAHSIKQTSDGGYVVGGDEYSTDGDVTGNHGNYDYWVIKLDNLGALLWQKTLGGTSNEYAYSLQVTSDGGFLISGYTQSNNGDVTNNHQTTGFRGLWDYWTVKLSPEGLLPLTLLSFNAMKQQNDVLMQWQTTSEINVSHFELQRSSNVVNYTSIATINATNISTLNNYRFTDANAVLNYPGKKLYYRLKMIDKDGHFKYSNVAVIDIPAGNAAISIYSNPAHNSIKINTTQVLTTIQVLDLSGRLVKQFAPMPANSYGISDLINGVYMLRLISNKDETILKFEKQ